MTKKKACIIGLFLFLVLYGLMFWNKWRPIEQDVASNIKQSLQAKGLDWIDVTTHDQGRDVSLSGIAREEGLIQQAKDIALTARGVRVVNVDGLDYRPFQQGSFSLKASGAVDSQQVTLSGSMHQGELLDELKSSLQSNYPDQDLSSIIANEDVRMEPWMSGISALVPHVAKLENGGLEVDKDRIVISGVSRNQQTVADLEQALAGFDSGDKSVKLGFQYRPLITPNISVSRQGGQLQITGQVPQAQEALMGGIIDNAGLGEFASVAYGGDAIDDASAQWMSNSAEFLQTVANTPNAEVSISGDKVMLSGEVDSPEIATALEGLAQSLGSNEVVNGLTFTLTPEEIEAARVRAEEAAAQAAADARRQAIAAMTPQALEERANVCRGDVTRLLAQDNIEFASGSAQLSESSNRLLDDLAAAVKACSVLRFEIAGHTDNTGNADKNLVLSEQRAASVVAYLLAKGVDRDQLSAAGYGSLLPIADNATDAGKKANRRIEFNIK